MQRRRKRGLRQQLMAYNMNFQTKIGLTLRNLGWLHRNKRPKNRQPSINLDKSDIDTLVAFTDVSQIQDRVRRIVCVPSTPDTTGQDKEASTQLWMNSHRRTCENKYGLELYTSSNYETDLFAKGQALLHQTGNLMYTSKRLENFNIFKKKKLIF